MIPVEFEGMKHLRAVRVIDGGQRLLNWRRAGESEELFPVGCIFKLCISMLIGAAIREGRIGAVSDPVTDYFGEEASASWENLTVAHALSKTTGLVWPGPGEKLPDSIGEMMKLPVSGAPGAAFLYKPDPQIAVCLLEHVYGKTVDALFDEKIGRRLHAPYQWNRNSIEGMRLSVDGLEALGRMLLDGGRGIFDEKYLEEMMLPRSQGGFPEWLPYGLGCWIGGMNGRRYLLASGFGGQMLAVSPEQRRIVIVLSDVDRPHTENRKIIEQLFERV